MKYLFRWVSVFAQGWSKKTKLKKEFNYVNDYPDERS